MEESLEFFSEYNDIRSFILSMPTFVLHEASTNAIVKKKSLKQSAVISVDSSCIKMIFTLLAEPIVVQMQFLKYKLGNRALKSCSFSSIRGLEAWTRVWTGFLIMNKKVCMKSLNDSLVDVDRADISVGFRPDIGMCFRPGVGSRLSIGCRDIQINELDKLVILKVSSVWGEKI